MDRKRMSSLKNGTLVLLAGCRAAEVRLGDERCFRPLW